MIAVRRDLAERHGLKTMVDFAKFLAVGRRFQLRGIGRVRRKPVGFASLRRDLRLPAQGRAIVDLVGRQYLGDVARRCRGDVGGQRCNGLGHRWCARGSRSHGAQGRQRGAGGLCPGAGRARSVLQQHPEVATVLDPVFASSDPRDIAELNAEIAVDGEDAGAVATAYLKSKHFLP